MLILMNSEDTQFAKRLPHPVRGNQAAEGGELRDLSPQWVSRRGFPFSGHREGASAGVTFPPEDILAITRAGF